MVVDVYWVSTSIKTCRLDRKIKARGPLCGVLSVRNVSLWDKARLHGLTQKIGVILKEAYSPFVLLFKIKDVTAS